MKHSNFNIKNILYLLIIIFAASSCRNVVIKIDKLPDNTPAGSPIYITGNFNYWDPGDANYLMTFNKDSSYSIELPVAFGDIEYKFTRGDWSTVEGDKCGFEIANRSATSIKSDTISNEIESWRDLEPINCDSIVIVLTQIPPNTPKNEPIKVAGNFNAWNPGSDSTYIAKKDKETGQLTVTIPREPGVPLSDIEYKIVRGNLAASEANKYGEEVAKRALNVSKEGKVYIKVENWEDLAVKRSNSVTIVLTKIPANTPDFSTIYLVGNFNDWMPGDKRYRFTKNEKGQYSITIPRKDYGLSFKITRGGWNTEAADENGNKLDNRDYNYDDIDTLYLTVDNWLDMAGGQTRVQTIVLKKVPKNTPADANIYLAGNYNNWNAKNDEFLFRRQTNGTYVLKILRSRDDFEYKLTRGDWANQEVDAFGDEIPNRRIKFRDDDTIYISVAMWKDLITINNDYVTVELVDLPKNTPNNSRIFIAGEFNNWDPGDSKYILKRNANGNFEINIQRYWLGRGFKFTRGSWKSVETTRFGGFVENRVYRGKDQRVQLKIGGWEDL